MMLSPEQEELRAARRALSQRDPTKPLSRDEIKRLNRAREAAYRNENYEEHYDRWLEEVARQLGRTKETVHLLTIDETYRLSDKDDRIRELP